MENFPNNEQQQRREWLITDLKEKGYEDPEVKETLQAWFKSQEDARGIEPGSEIKDMIEYAELLRDAGLAVEAKEVLEDAIKNAWQGFQDVALCDRIETMIDSL